MPPDPLDGVDSLTSSLASLQLAAPLSLPSRPCPQCGCARPAEWNDDSAMGYYLSKVRVDDSEDVRAKTRFWSNVVQSVLTHGAHVPRLTVHVANIRAMCTRQGDAPAALDLALSQLIAEGTLLLTATLPPIRAVKVESSPSDSGNESAAGALLASPLKLVSMTARGAWTLTRTVARAVFSPSKSSTLSLAPDTRLASQSQLHSYADRFLSTLTDEVLTMDELVARTPSLTSDDRDVLLRYLSDLQHLVELVPMSASKLRVLKLGRPVSAVTPLDYERATLQHIHALTTKRIASMRAAEDSLAHEARRELQAKRREVAKSTLAKAKRMRAHVVSLESQCMNIQQVIDAMIQAHEQASVIAALSSAQRSLAQFQSQHCVDSVEDLMDELRESTEHATEIDRVLSEPTVTSGVDLDDDELLAELNAMQAEAEAERAIARAAPTSARETHASKSTNDSPREPIIIDTTTATKPIIVE